MALFGGIGGSRRSGSATRSTVAGPVHEWERKSRAATLAQGTLACDRCDAPVAAGPTPLRLTDVISCPFCDRRAPVRAFLSLAVPTRPARVVVRLALPPR